MNIKDIEIMAQESLGWIYTLREHYTETIAGLTKKEQSEIKDSLNKKHAEVLGRIGWKSKLPFDGSPTA